LFRDSRKTLKSNVGRTQNFCLSKLLVHKVSFRLQVVKLPATQRFIPAGQNRMLDFGCIFFWLRTEAWDLRLYINFQRFDTCVCWIPACASFDGASWNCNDTDLFREVPGSILDRYTDYSEVLS